MLSKEQLTSALVKAIAASAILGAIFGGIASAITFSLASRGDIPYLGSKDTRKDTVTSPEQLSPNDNGISSDETVNVVEGALPAVVSIIATQELASLPQSSFFNDFFFGFPFEIQPSPRDQEEPKIEKREVSSGSGFIVTKDGFIVTNRHVVLNTKAEYSVVLNSGKTYEAEVIDRDSVQDLAVVKIKVKVGETADFRTLPLGDSNTVKLGATVIAIGNTLGEFRNTVTKGIVSGINRTLTAGGEGIGNEVIEGAIQTDAAISSGNSGGPLLNVLGEVIGVNTAVSEVGENIGFALPVDQVRIIVESIEKYGKIVRPFLGVRYLILNEEIAKKNNMDEINEGALIQRGEGRDELAVVPGSPADKAGLRENDIIVSIDDRVIKAGQSLATLLARYKPGDMITLKVYRAGKRIDLQVTLEDRKGK